MKKSTPPVPPARGRPPAFDRDEALERAMHVFWQQGYEATSMGDLTRAMGLSASSLYAAFGDKESLYLAAIDRYVHSRGSYPPRILAEAPDARTGIERLFKAAAREITRKDQPAGCMITLGLGQCSSAASSVVTVLKRWRASTQAVLEEAIVRDIDAGRLPRQTDAGALAAFFAAVLQGMSVQARDGVPRSALEQIGRTAMRAWPEASRSGVITRKEER